VVRVQREGEAACLAARVLHRDSPDEFGPGSPLGGDARMAVTVASGGRLAKVKAMHHLGAL